MHLHKLKKSHTLQKIIQMKYLFQGTLRKKIDSIQENTIKSSKKVISTIKENKITLKNRKNLTLLSPLALPSAKNEHTISIEGRIVKCSFERSFRIAHITNR